MFQARFTFLCTFLLPFLLLGCDSAPDEHYQLPSTFEGENLTLLHAKKIITLSNSMPTATAVMMHEDRIVGVGEAEQLRQQFAGANISEQGQLQDKVIVPGFISQHIHPVLAALTMSMEIISIEDWVLPERTVKAVQGREGYLARLKSAEAAMEDTEEPLLTWGFHHYFHGGLSRQDLDVLSDTRPILVWHRSAHEFILNSAALNLLQIDEAFAASFEPEVQKQMSVAKGHFWEQGMFAVQPKLQSMLASPARLYRGLQFVERYLHSNGITLASEPGGLQSKVLLLAQMAVLADGDTPFRTYFIPDGKSLLKTSSQDELIADTEAIIAWSAGRTQFLPKQVKLFADGAIFSQTMQMLEPYLDGHSGEWITEPDTFKQAFRQYWEAGYQIHVHQNGDAGLELLLDTLSENLERFPREDHRTVIVHFGFSTPAQVKRIAQLGALVSANPYYPVALADRYSEFGLGPERATQMVRLGDVDRENISFSLHSDMPMAPGKPLFLMWSAVNRLTFSNRVAGPAQRITPEAALRAVTLDAAYSLRLEHLVGSVEVGKLANFSVLEKDPLDVDPVEIKDIQVWGTVHEGRFFPVRQ